MAIKQMIKDQRLDLGSCCFLQFLRIAGVFSIGRAIALGINIRREQNVLPIRRPKFAARFGRNRQSAWSNVGHCSRCAIEIRDPDLRSALFVEINAKRFPSGAQRGRSAS